MADRQAPLSVTQPSPLCIIPRKTLEASAICRYDLTEVQAVFAGPYMEYQDGVRRWGRYEGGVPEPRPGSVREQAWGRVLSRQNPWGGLEGLALWGAQAGGQNPWESRILVRSPEVHHPCPLPQCITDSLRSQGYNSSQDLPSLVLDFVKLHPLMARPVVPTRGRPLLLKRSVRYTHLTGTPVTTPAGPTYDLLFLSTGASDPWPKPSGDC